MDAMDALFFEPFGTSIEVIQACIVVSGSEFAEICRIGRRLFQDGTITDDERTAINAFLRVWSRPDVDETEQVWEIAGRLRDPRKRGLRWKQSPVLRQI